MKKFFIVLFLGLGLHIAKAQNHNDETIGGFWHVNTGLSFQNYQNLKAARYQLSGTGINFGLGWSKESKNNIWDVSIGLDNVNLMSDLSNLVETNSVQINLSFDYLRNLKKGKTSWFMGLGYDANFNIFDNQKLQNDGATYNFLNSLLLRSIIRQNFTLLGRSICGEFSMGFGLIAYGKDTKSYAFTAPQGFLENGKFHYQGATDDINNPIKNLVFMHLGDYRRIQTGLKLRVNPKLGKKHFWELGYKWNYYSYEDVPNHRVTSGTHSLTVTYNFMLNRMK